MIARIIIAQIVALAVVLGCILLGLVLGSLNLPPADAIGGLLTTYAWPIGILAGLWHFFRGGP